MTALTKGIFALTSAVFLSLLFPLTQPGASARTLNGFDLSEALIPPGKIFRGGPPRDGIPAIMLPRFEPAAKVRWLKDSDLVAGVVHGGESKAYPLRILVWHEAVNDTVAGTPILMSYCPLCGSTVAYKRDIRGTVYTFKISGLLHESNVLFYDEQTESLWSQLALKAVSGKMKGTEMSIFPSVLATWKEWKSRHPASLVLTRATGSRRDYGRDPYGGYERSRSVYFPVSGTSERYHPKERVLVVTTGGGSKVYPFSELRKAPGPISDEVGGEPVTVLFNGGDYVTALRADGSAAESFVTFWFAWYAFRPDTPVYTD